MAHGAILDTAWGRHRPDRLDRGDALAVGLANELNDAAARLRGVLPEADFARAAGTSSAVALGDQVDNGVASRDFDLRQLTADASQAVAGPLLDLRSELEAQALHVVCA